MLASCCAKCSLQPRSDGLAGFAGFGLVSATQRAMQVAPEYWVQWYTVKSLLLVGVTAALAYQLGKHSK